MEATTKILKTHLPNIKQQGYQPGHSIWYEVCFRAASEHMHVKSFCKTCGNVPTASIISFTHTRQKMTILKLQNNLKKQELHNQALFHIMKLFYYNTT
jgi:hypothetical protein